MATPVPVPVVRDERIPSRVGSDLFFWSGSRVYGFLANDYAALFVVDGARFDRVSRFMWYAKANVASSDGGLATLIREEKDFEKARGLARRVRLRTQADLETWKGMRLNLMARAIMRKFQCNDDLRELLFSTGKRPLYYASKYDAYYGIGFTMTLGRLRSDLWGTNYLGKILMLVRERLMELRTRGDAEDGERSVVSQPTLCARLERSGKESCKNVGCILCATEEKGGAQCMLSERIV